MAEVKSESEKVSKKDTEKKPLKFICKVKCYAGDQVFNPGDTVEGLDLSNNANFAKAE